MSDETRGEQLSGVEQGGGGLTSERDEDRAERAGDGDSEQDEQAVRESTDQLDTGGTR